MLRTINKKGFTLVEIMIIVGVIGVLTAIAMPNYARARRKSQSVICMGNLREIEHAVQVWALDNNRLDTDTPSWGDLAPQYIRIEPSCPAQGLYTIGSVQNRPTCSLGDTTTKEHILLQ